MTRNAVIAGRYVRTYLLTNAPAMTDNTITIYLIIVILKNILSTFVS